MYAKYEKLVHTVFKSGTRYSNTNICFISYFHCLHIITDKYNFNKSLKGEAIVHVRTQGIITALMILFLANFELFSLIVSIIFG